jgi:S1-C subfamily serine protease
MYLSERKKSIFSKTVKIALLAIVSFYCLDSSAQENKGKAGLQPTQRAVFTTNQIYEKYKDKIYTVISNNVMGTGFSWLRFAILTCFHVVKGCPSVTASRSGLKTALELSRVVTLDKDLDAIVFLASENKGEIPIGKSSELKIGDKLVVIGSPQGLEQSVSEGILSGRRKVGVIEYLQLSVPISPGSSGSPVFNKYGEVVGMVTASITEGQQLNFAVGIDSVMEMTPGVALGSISGEMLPEMIPVSSMKISSKELTGSPDFSIVVEKLPEEITWSISEAQVRQWIRDELARSASMAGVISVETQQERSVSLRNGMLGGMDAAAKFLHITIHYLRSDLGISFYSIRLEFNRPAIAVTGISYVPAWENTVGGYFGSSHSVVDRIRDAIQNITRDFAVRWSIDNKGS